MTNRKRIDEFLKGMRKIENKLAMPDMHIQLLKLDQGQRFVIRLVLAHFKTANELPSEVLLLQFHPSDVASLIAGISRHYPTKKFVYEWLFQMLRPLTNNYIPAKDELPM